MNEHTDGKQGNIIYFSHGGGPLPLLGDPGHEIMISFMNDLPRKFPKPDDILVISAHWEESVPTIIGNKTPSLLYDYYGFPPESYEFKYPAPGNPKLAKEVSGLLSENGIPCKMTMERGFDHGLFVPLIMMYPGADIPVTELSLIRSLNSKEHIDLGKALKKLTEKNILIIGSGFSFHNMSAFAGNDGDQVDARNDEFQNWLIDVCTGSYDAGQRENMLINWSKAPGSRYCHPREEHLLPLHVCIGIAGEKGKVIFDDYIMGKRAVAFKW